MTDLELLTCFDLEVNSEGQPVIDFEGEHGRMLGPREAYKMHLKFNCITDPAEAERLWQEREAKRKAVAGE